MISQAWFTKGRKLSAATTPLEGYETLAKDIYLNEYGDEISTRNMRLSLNVTSAASMDFVTTTDVFRNDTKRQVLLGSILGGYVGLINKRSVPMVHPYFPGMYAKDIQNEQTVSIEEASDADVINTYNLTKFTINFESLEYFPGTFIVTEPDGFNQNWVRYESKDANQRIQAALGWYQVNDPDFPAYKYQPAMLGNWLNQPLSYVTFTFHQVLQSNIFSSAASFKPKWAALVGYCNNAAIAGTDFDAEELMLQGGQANLYWNWEDVPLADVQLTFLYTPWTWNKTLTWDANRASVSFVGDPLKKPFPTGNFTSLFNTINPVD